MILFLTGTIQPIGVIKTSLTDPIIREKHYCDAINFYLKATKCKIVFVENSNWSIAHKFEEFKNRIEFLTYDGNKNGSKGKGFGEMEICEYFIKNSQFLVMDKVFMKITGRYKLINIHRILTYYLKRSTENDTMIDLKNKGLYSDSRCFISNSEFLSRFLFPQKKLIDDSKGYYFEHALATAAKKSINEGQMNLLFPAPPIYKGIYATDNIAYSSSWLRSVLKHIYYKIKSIYYVHS